MAEEQFNALLAKDLSDVDSYLANDDPDRVMGKDVEATCLDTRRARLVGTSISLTDDSAMYIPIGHRVGTNLPKDAVYEKLRRKVEEEKYKALVYNLQYDHNVDQANAGWCPPVQLSLDVLELVYLENPDRKQKGLKLIAKEELGADLSKFESLFTPEEVDSGVLDISGKSPERCRVYACADAWATRAIRNLPKFRAVETEFDFAVRIDTAVANIVRKMEHNGGMRLNRAYIDEQIEMLEQLGRELADIVYRQVGKHFEINSPKQLGIALFETMGLPSPGMTNGKNPIHKTGAEELEKLAETYPIAEYVVSYRKVVKARTTYFEKLRRLDDSQKPVRFNFNIYSAPTFRFAAPGGDPDKDGATGVNIQAVSNGEMRDIQGVALSVQKDEDNYLKAVEQDDILVPMDPNIPLDQLVEGAVSKDDFEEATPLISFDELPFVLKQLQKDKEGKEYDELVCIRDTCKGCKAGCDGRGIDVTRRLQKNVKMVPSVRQAFCAPDGYVLLSFDYDRQELTIGANMSGEPKWIEAMKAGIDLHEKTAAAAFGMPIEVFQKLAKAEYKEKRDIGKVLNFATFYGATEWTLSRKANIPIARAKNIYDNFKREHAVLFSWMDKVHLFARKNGYTTTYFGRRRWLKQYYALNDKKMQAFADRSAVNTAIQGTGAEVTRIAMVKCDNAIQKAGWTNKDIRFACQIHDELMFMVKTELVQDAITVLRPVIAFEVKKWPVQLSCDPKVGTVWGLQKKIKMAAAA